MKNQIAVLSLLAHKWGDIRMWDNINMRLLNKKQLFDPWEINFALISVPSCCIFEIIRLKLWETLFLISSKEFICVYLYLWDHSDPSIQ